MSTTETTTQTREQRDAELYLAYMLASKNATAAAKASGVARSSLQDAVKRHTARLAAEEADASSADETAEITDQASTEAYIEDVASRQDNQPADAAPATDTTDAPVEPAEKKSRKARTAGDKPAVNDLPYGVVTPVAFRHQMVAEGLAPETLRTQTVYDWVKHNSSNGFPVKHYPFTGDVDVFDAPQRDEDGKATTRPGVLLSQARDWLVAKTERDAAKAEAKAAA